MGGVTYETWSHMEPWRFSCYIEIKLEMILPYHRNNLVLVF